MTTKIKLSSNVSDVDLTTTAPTNGQGLIYNSTSSKWVPGAAGGGVTVYDTIDNLPLSGVSTGDLALVDSTNKLYLWMDTGWYNIATINTNPSITAGNNTHYLLALDGTPTVITLTASDPEGIPLTWSYEVTSGSLTNGGGTTATVSNDGSGQFTVTPTTTEAYAGAFSLTFKASDGVNLGTTVAAFTLAFRVADSKYTSLLVKALASGANSTFVDSSTNNFTITKNGDVTQGTFSPFSQPDGAWSNYFDGAGDYLSIPSSAEFTFATGDFTIEYWQFRSVASSNAVFDMRSDGSTTNISIGFDGSVYIGVFTVLAASTSIGTGVWDHVALVRRGFTMTRYVNGVSDASTTNTSNFVQPSIFYIGVDYSTSNFINGYVSGLRVVKGTAVYTSAFTPPTAPLTAVTNTSLLTCQSNRFKDNSTNGFAITVAGNTAVSPFCPFDRLAYNSAIHGGGAYFDGTGDSLSGTTNFEASTSQSTFTMEGWVYPTTFANLITIFGGVVTTSGDTKTLAAEVNTSGNIALYWYDGAVKRCTGNSVLTLNAWNYFAIVVTSNSIAIYVNKATQDTLSGTTTLTNRAQQYLLGVGCYYNGGAPQYFAGYLSGLRYSTSARTISSVPTAPFSNDADVRWLLNCTNANIIDNDSKNNLKLFGNTAASATQTKYAARSVYFDGTGDYLLGGDITLGAADFTIECWWYTGSTSRQAILHGSNGYDHSYAIDYNSRGNYTMGIWASSTGSSWNLANADAGGNGIGSATIAQNTWTHIAFVRNGTVLRLYVNGTLDVEITGVSAAVATRPSNQPIIGMWFNGTQYANSGYIEDLRITKGLARYTANFTPPTSELLG